MSQANMKIEVDSEGIATLRMTHPPVNALDADYCDRLDDALRRLADEPGVRALVITGEGRCFSAGLDLKTVPGLDQAGQDALARALNRLFGGLYGYPVPTVAAINGHAIAGGMVLALCCDQRVCVRGTATLGLTEVKVGVPFPVAALEVSRGELTPAARRAMILLGRTIDPHEALAFQAVDELVRPEGLMGRACEIAAEAALLPPNSFRKVKRQLRAAALERIGDAVERDAEPLLGDWLTEETREAATAMLAASA